MMKIAVANSVTSKQWRNIDITWKDMLKRFKTPVRTGETFQEYQKMTKAEKAVKKGAAGCFVGGDLLRPGRRTVPNLHTRCLITLDADDGASFDDWDTATTMENCAMAVYTTHSHTVKAPRLRWIIPLKHPVTPEQGEAVARKMAVDLGIMESLDPTTFRVVQAMFWPTCAVDAPYDCRVQDGPFLDPDAVLSRYDDWKDTASWPISTREKAVRKQAEKKKKNPTEIAGIVGAFCRCYDVHDAIQTFLTDVYLPTETDNRYTYANGTTAAGLVVYDSGLFAYSNHATDPVSGQLCNAFDLVRIHLYGEKDADVKPDTPLNKYPSYLEMSRRAAADENVVQLLSRERMERAKADFDQPTEANDVKWEMQMERDAKGNPTATLDNVCLILLNDPFLKGKIAYNEFKRRNVSVGDLPWRKTKDTVNGDTWKETDDGELRRFIGKYYKIHVKQLVVDSVGIAAEKNAFHPVRDYLNSLQWDGVPRLDTLLIDYLGADDTPYVRAVTRKTFTAAVARIYEPGCKFDYVLTFSGPQARGKTTLVTRMGRGWFSNSLEGIGTKEGYEGLQGYWLIELGELSALRKAEIETIKNFISKTQDSFRAAYARRVEDNPRQCVFIATTNATDFLRDDTGNRRFWPVRLNEEAPAKTVWDDLTDEIIDQLWAEACMNYQIGEPLTLSPELAAVAFEQQAEFTERDSRQGLVEAYLDTPLPAAWNSWSIEDRKMWFMSDESTREAGYYRRDYVCALEVWVECLRQDRGRFARVDRREITSMLRQIPGWREDPKRQRCGPYGLQNRFARVSVPKNGDVTDVTVE